MRQRLTEFVQRLRGAGVRISLAETLDAMHAVKLAGVEPEVVREALAATLIKDEADRERFLELFAEYFAAPPLPGANGRGRKPRRAEAPGGADGDAARGGAGSGGGRGTGRESRSHAEPPSDAASPSHVDPARERARAPESSAQAPPERSRPRATAAAAQAAEKRGVEASESSEASTRQGARPRPRGIAAIARLPFHEMSERDVEAAREAARELGRLLAARASRREESARRGRADFRRTIRASLARGGTMIDVKYRGRRPGKPRLVALCDVSWSASLASELLLGILAAAEGAFSGVTRYAFVDRLVPISFESGHVAPEGPLDLHARSDHGAVLCQLEADRAAALDRSTVLLILGDARNNRRPARADALRRLAARARGVIWAVPEARARWNTGDSALASYAPWCSFVLEATTLDDLVRALRRAER